MNRMRASAWKALWSRVQTYKSQCQSSRWCNLDRRPYKENGAEATEPKQLLITEFCCQNSTAIFVSKDVYTCYEMQPFDIVWRGIGDSELSHSRNTWFQRQLLVLMLLLTLDVLINRSSFSPSRAFLNGQYDDDVDPANENMHDEADPANESWSDPRVSCKSWHHVAWHTDIQYPPRLRIYCDRLLMGE